MSFGAAPENSIERLVYRVAVLATLIAAGAACVVAPAAALAGTLDQQQTDASDSVVTIYVGQSAAQTFTAGLSGGVDQVDLYLGTSGGPLPTAPLSIEIRGASGGVPGTTVLASRSVPAFNAARAFLSVHFATPAPVVAGTQYAIVVYSGASFSNVYTWSYSMTANPYAGGAGFRTVSSPPSGTWDPLTGGEDFAFKTYVTPTATCKGQQATLVGTAGNDAVTGTAGNDVIAALEGNDKVSGLSGKDLICGGAGKDTLNGGGGKDTLLGEAGKDKLVGGGAKDICKGGKGNDSATCEVEKSV